MYMNWGRKYLCRLLGRNPGRSLLSLLLAALLAFAFGLVTELPLLLQFLQEL